MGLYGASGASAAPYAYVANQSGSVSQFDASQGALAPLSPASVPGGAGESGESDVEPIGLAVSPDGRSLYVPSPDDDEVREYSIGADGALTPKALQAVLAGDRPIAAAVSPDGDSVWVVDEDSDEVSQFDVLPDGTLAAKTVKTLPAGDAPVAIAVRPDGRSVYVANSQGATISQYDVEADGALSPESPATAPAPAPAGGGPPDSLAIAPDGKTLYAAVGSLRQYDISDSGALSLKAAPEDPGPAALGLAVAPGGRDLYVNDAVDGFLSTYKIDTDGVASVATAVISNSLAPAVAPDGHSVYAPDRFGRLVDQWDASDGSLTKKAPATVSLPSFPTAIVVSPSSDVALSAATADGSVAAGQSLTTTYRVTNTGSVATDVRLSVPLGGDLTLQSAAASQGVCAMTGEVDCTLGSLAQGESATVTATVRTLTPGTVSQTATVSAAQPDPDSANNAATVVATVTSAPLATTGAASDLAPDAATLNGVVVPNGLVTTYQFEYGPDGALDEQTPAATAGDGSDGVAVAAPIDGLEPGTTYSYRLVAQNSDGATATGGERTFTTPEQPAPTIDLSLAGSASAPEATVGGRLAYAFTVTNGSSTDAASGVRVTDPLPGGTAFDAAASSPACTASSDGTTVTCAVGTLAPSASATVQVAVTAGQAGALLNTAHVAGDQLDPHSDDNVASVRTTVDAPPTTPTGPQQPGQETPTPPEVPTSGPVTPTPGVSTKVSVRGTPRLKGSELRATLRCQAAAGARCSGTASLTARMTEQTGSHAKHASHVRTVKLGTVRYAIAAGKEATVSIRLSRSARALLASAHRLSATLTVRLGSSATAAPRVQRRVTLRAVSKQR
ncbi:MAG TPA: beta-propeller fold lactonase family protein [Conexibacter sp.]